MKIKTRILSILALLACGYLLQIAMVQFTATTTHSRMSEISASLFPAALKMQEAESAFERMKKHYGDSVVLQDAAPIASAEKDAADTAAALSEVRNVLASSPELSKQVDALTQQFDAIRKQDHETYSALVAAKSAPSDELMGQVDALGKENNALTAAMGQLDKGISVSFQKQLAAVDRSSLTSRITVTMNAMSSAVQESSNTTQRAAEDARTAEESAKMGGAKVQSTVQSIGDLLKMNE